MVNLDRSYLRFHNPSRRDATFRTADKAAETMIAELISGLPGSGTVRQDLVDHPVFDRLFG